jgi:hypothetical protein
MTGRSQWLAMTAAITKVEKISTYLPYNRSTHLSWVFQKLNLNLIQPLDLSQIYEKYRRQKTNCQNSGSMETLGTKMAPCFLAICIYIYGYAYLCLSLSRCFFFVSMSMSVYIMSVSVISMSYFLPKFSYLPIARKIVKSINLCIKRDKKYISQPSSMDFTWILLQYSF